MKKLIALLIIMLLFSLAGCSVPSKNDPITMVFPASYMNERTEHNAAIFSIDNFMLSFKLPNGWQGVRARESVDADTEIRLLGVWSIHDIFNEKGERVGAIGFNIYEPYPDAEDEPIAIYNQIALGNDYKFDVKDSYSVIAETASGITATTDVYYSASINAGKEKINKGIVSYNKELQVYIAIEFAGDMVTDEQAISVANSITISSPNQENGKADTSV